MTYQKRARELVKAACIGALVTTLAACNPNTVDRRTEREKEWQTIESTLQLPTEKSYYVFDNKDFIDQFNQFIESEERYAAKNNGGKARRDTIIHPVTQDTICRFWPEITFDEEKKFRNFLQKYRNEDIFFTDADSTYIFYVKKNERIRSQTISHAAFEPFFFGITKLRFGLGYDRFFIERTEKLAEAHTELEHTSQPPNGKIHEFNNNEKVIKDLESYIKSTKRAKAEGWGQAKFRLIYKDSVEVVRSWWPENSMEDDKSVLQFVKDHKEEKIYIVGTDSTYIFYTKTNQHIDSQIIYRFSASAHMMLWMMNSMVTAADSSY